MEHQNYIPDPASTARRVERAQTYLASITTPNAAYRISIETRHGLVCQPSTKSEEDNLQAIGMLMRNYHFGLHVMTCFPTHQNNFSLDKMELFTEV